MTKPAERFLGNYISARAGVIDTGATTSTWRVAAGLIACALFLTLPGCAWFGSSDKKPPALPAVPATNAASLVWTSSVGKSGGYLFVPGFGDKLVYVASNGGDVYALAEEGGRTVTRIETKVRLAGGVGVGENLVVVASVKGDVLAFDAAGRSLWKASVAGDVLAAPAVVGDKVIVRTADGRIFALNRIDGKRQWVFQRATPALTLRTNAGVVSNRGTLYAGYPGGKVVAIEVEGGKPIWEATISLARGATELERVADVAGAPVLDDSRVCAAVYQGRTGCVETLSGNVLWSREISSPDGVAVDAKNVYVADTGGNVFALDKTNGATLWKLEKLVLRDPGTPILVNGKLVVGDKDGLIHVMSPENGDLIGRLSTDGSRIISLLKNGDGAVAQTDKGGVFAINVK
ncbi:MAG: outer membrane protein assembly factor BamB [Burkholderiales bacterium]|nr:outer membrane protein assembly factor BamB [Burkholderiales bacterium]